MASDSPVSDPPSAPASPGNSSQSRLDLPPPYSALHHSHGENSMPWDSKDPRTSSTQSLVPSLSGPEGRRRLLLIYAHGFMGDETSFQSFPAHVHNLVTLQLAESHVVHTKIYPRYRSRKAIQVATNDFSTWLTPHESPTTDIILLGHSMGGLLIAEVELLRPYEPGTSAFRHRLLGTVNFDVPFLGLHPGIIKSGLSSLFRPAPSPKPATSDLTSSMQESSSTLSFSTTTSDSTQTGSISSEIFEALPPDPNYNPAFANDVLLPIRKGWRNALHFFNKHSNDLAKASQNWLVSHYEFGSVLADFKGLKVRYSKIRALEEDNQQHRQSVFQDALPPPRIRFVNYYTASTGRIKKPKSPKLGESGQTPPSLMAGPPSTEEVDLQSTGSRPRTPQLSVQEHQEDGGFIEKPIPLSPVISKDDASVESGQNVIDEELSEADQHQFEPPGPSAIPTIATTISGSDVNDGSKTAKRKERTFCILPSKDAAGNPDQTWTRLLMEGVDEVGAHCGLFFISQDYARLVGDVAERIEQWVKDDMTQRAIQEFDESI